MEYATEKFTSQKAFAILNINLIIFDYSSTYVSSINL